MSRKNAKIVTEDGSIYHKPQRLALSLVAAGLAELTSPEPNIIVQLIPLTHIGQALIPGNCRNFIEEYAVLAGYRFNNNHRTRKPRGSVERQSVDHGYVPLPVDLR